MVSTRSRTRAEAVENVAVVEVYTSTSVTTPNTTVNTKPKKTKKKASAKRTKVIVLKYNSEASSNNLETLTSRPKRKSASIKGSVGSKPKGITKKTNQKSEAGLKGLKVVLRLKYSDITPGKLIKMGIKAKRLPKGYYPYRGKSFKLGHNPWEHLNFPKPSEEQVRNVHKLLVDHHNQFEIGTFVSQPAHAARATVTVDAAIQTILAQSTGNEMAIDAHSRLCNKFTYLVNGKKHVGTIPNWHDVRRASKEELEQVLKPGGYQIIRAKAIKALLDIVYAKNEERKAAGVQQYQHDGNPPEADNFVPGMLSLEYITDIEDDNDEKLLGRLTDLPQIGFKSAMCIMAFQLKRPLFVVDTHVLRYMKWLGWIPKHAKENAAAQYLHTIIPDDIKYDLHNQIWTHCANENAREGRGRQVLCHFCGSNPPAKNKDTSTVTCPLRDLLPPLAKRWGREYVEPEQGDIGMTDVPIIKEEEDISFDINDIAREITMSDPLSAAGNQTVTIEMTEIKVEKTVKTKITKKQTTLESFVGLPAQSDKSDSEAGSPISTTSTKVKKRKLKETMLFDELTPEEAKEAGYLLWEFRPMDNSFMEEWGTFDKMPRYKWEKPTIMDPDVAVDPEHARKVMAGEVPHRWSKKEL